MNSLPPQPTPEHQTERLNARQKVASTNANGIEQTRIPVGNSKRKRVYSVRKIFSHFVKQTLMQRNSDARRIPLRTRRMLQQRSLQQQQQQVRARNAPQPSTHAAETALSTISPSDHAARIDALSQQNTEFWSKLKTVEKTLQERDAEIVRLKSECEILLRRAQIAENSLLSAKTELICVKEDNETLKETLKSSGSDADPLQWKRKCEDVQKKYDDLSWDRWVDHCRARGKDPYD